MIPNIVVPMPMPVIVGRGGGNIENLDKGVISLLLAIFVVSIIVALIGYLYDVIKTKNWRLSDFNERCMATEFGLMFAVVDLVIGATIGVFVLIKSWL